MKTGKVFLVGAGPGDPGLMTVKGRERLQQADVVIYDRLVNEDLLEAAPRRAQKIFVGKAPHSQAVEQSEINRLLIAQALQGKNVVRLKGGDPFVLGRGGEEAAALAKKRIPFEVVPGVSSAVAVPAYAGIPVTHRGLSSSFAVVTGSRETGRSKPEIPWDKLSTATDTLVFLMGAETLEEHVQRLIANGRPAGTPVAIIEHGTGPRQRTLVGTLGNIASKARRENLRPPAVIVVGNVVRLRKRLRWFDVHPLFGKRVLVTRPRRQAVELSSMLKKCGAQPVETPVIDIKPAADPADLDDAIRHLRDFLWIVFTSANGVEVFFRRLSVHGFDSRWLSGVRIGAIGPATAAALKTNGIIADLLPAKFTSRGLLSALKREDLSGKRVLLPRADIAGEELARGLALLGAEPREVAAYRTLPDSAGISHAAELLAKGEIDIVLFTSASTVTNLTEVIKNHPASFEKTVTVCIGPQTAAAARKAGLKPDIVARKHTLSGLLEAIELFYQTRHT